MRLCKGMSYSNQRVGRTISFKGRKTIRGPQFRNFQNFVCSKHLFMSISSKNVMNLLYFSVFVIYKKTKKALACLPWTNCKCQYSPTFLSTGLLGIPFQLVDTRVWFHLTVFDSFFDIVDQTIASGWIVPFKHARTKLRLHGMPPRPNLVKTNSYLH